MAKKTTRKPKSDRPRGRPLATIKTRSIGVRLDDATIARIDAFLPKLQESLGNLGVSLIRDRSAVLRALIERGLHCSGAC